ncbi:MAG: acyl-CoA dehydratase activase [Candidatus Korobacteraceae bacterium]
MSINIGLDIGAVSLKLAAIGGDEDRASFEALTAKSEAFFAGHFPEISGLAGRPLVLSRYRRIQGSPIQSTFDLLRELYEQVPERAVEGIRVTGSGSQLIAKILGIYFENEFRALAKGVRLFYPEVRTVFEMGGETSKYVRLEPSGRSKYLGIVDYSSSGDCAAGTGSFIDQQASRLLYQVEQVGAAACQASCAARIAGRCSVFAKSDMIHAQQKGYTTDQILRGLCDAVARNFKSAIVKGREVELPVAFIGGVALNGGVQAALREAFKFADGQFIVPELYAWMSALGAAIFESEETRKRSFKRIHQLEQHAQAKQTFACSDPLSMEKVVLLRHRVQEQTPVTLGSKPGRKVEAYLGIDIGSVSTNLVVIDHEGKLLHEIYLRTQGRPIEVVSAGLKEIEEKFGDRLEVRGVGTTGSGRELVGELVGADTVNDEITAHKTGATYVCNQLGMEPVDTIFEIGGQDSKFIRLDKGIVVDFTMNEACAAGTGSFLEEQAEKLGVSIKGEFASLALASKRPARLGERCTVFMERDVTALLLKGAEVGDLCAGLAYSVALNYLNRVVRGRKIGNTIFFQGGTAYNDAVAAAFSLILQKPIIVPPHNGVIGAIGMALIASERMQASGARTRAKAAMVAEAASATRVPTPASADTALDLEHPAIPQVSAEQPKEPFAASDTPTQAARLVSKEFLGGAGAGAPGEAPLAVMSSGAAPGNGASKFRGYDLEKVNFTSREFVCKACSNFCDMKEFKIEGERSYWGDKCSDKFRKRAKTDRKPLLDDLLGQREELLHEALRPPSGKRPTVGIPRAMFYYDRFPFWCAYMQEVGFDVVLSSPTDRQICAAGDELAIAQPCFPVKVAHGHVQELLAKGVDYILVPNTINSEVAPWLLQAHPESHLCPWNQTLPYVLKAVPQLEEAAGKILNPTTHFRYGRKHAEKELAKFFGARLRISGRANNRAVTAAYAAQGAFDQALQELGAQAMARLQQTREPALVLVGRPYNLYDRSVNCDIPRKLRSLYGVDVLPMDFLPLENEDITDVNRNMYWNSGRRILAAARLTRRHPNLHVVYISNFKCGPDSYIKSFLNDAGGKPSLLLQFDGHANDAGFITRCEAYLDSKGFLRCPTAAVI